MDERMNNETNDVLIEALERVKAFSQKIQEERERRLWKEVNLPYSLFGAFDRLSKDNLDRIRKIRRKCKFHRLGKSLRLYFQNIM